MNRTEDSFVKKNKKSSIAILPSSKSTASSTNLMLSSTRPTYLRNINANNFYDGFFNYNRIGLFLVILFIFIGIGIMLILGNTFDVFLMNLQNYLLSTFGLLGTSAGSIVHTGADVGSDAAKIGIDIVEDSLHNAGNLMAGNTGYNPNTITDSSTDENNITDPNTITDGNTITDANNITDPNNITDANNITDPNNVTYIDTDSGRYIITDTGTYKDTDTPTNTTANSGIENYTNRMNNMEGNPTRENSMVGMNPNQMNQMNDSRGFDNIHNKKQYHSYEQRLKKQHSKNPNYNGNPNYSKNPNYNKNPKYNGNPQYNGNVYLGSKSVGYNDNDFSKPHVFGNIVPAWTKTNSYYNPNSTAGNIQFNAWNHNHQPTSINRALNKPTKTFYNAQADTSDDIIQKQISSGKKGWCLIGEYQNKRGCVSVLEDDICMSGQLFPSKEMCLNPSIGNRV